MAATQAFAASAMLEPVYLVVPSTFPVHVLPDSVTSPVDANTDVCPQASNDMAAKAAMHFFTSFSFCCVLFYMVGTMQTPTPPSVSKSLTCTDCGVSC